MEDILAQALTTCLINIKQFSKDDKNALLYFCINQSSLLGGIRSNVQALNQNSTSSMVSEFMATFHRFLSSNAEMPLDNSFEIYFHVASAKDPGRPTHRRKAIPIRSLVGSGDDAKRFILPGSLIDFPTGSPANPNCFKDSCLLVCLAYSIMELRKPELFEQVKPIIFKRSNVNKKNLAAALLLKEIEQFCFEKQMSLKGPHDLLCTIRAFSEMYQVQCVVILTMKGSKPEIITWPEEYDQCLPRLYFLLKKNNSNNDHIFIIRSLATFFQTYRRAICFFCKSFYYCGFGTIKSTRHKCRSAHSCQKCFGIFEPPNCWKNKTEPWSYCDLKTANVDITIVCSKCGVDFKSQICHDNHLKFCNLNNYYWQCVVCQKSVSMMGRDVKVVEETHKCNETDKFCITCVKYMPKGHICAISKTEKSSIWPNLAAVSLMFQDINGALCQVCYNLQANYMQKNNLNYKQLLQSENYYELTCDSHKTKKSSVPNVIKLYYESDRFHFRGETFSDNNFLLATLPLCETFNLGYSTDPLPKSNFSSRKRKRPNNDSLLKINGPLTAVNQLLNYFVELNLRNYTVLVQTNQEMLFLLETLLENFWHPTVVQSGRVVKKINVADMDITFLLFENYCKGTLGDLLKQFEIKRSVFYFPMALNDVTYHGNTVRKPDFSFFQTFIDTADEVNEKLIFYNKLEETIDVNQFLFQCLSENLKSFLMCVTKFIELCFELQSVISNVTGNQQPQACHPFDPKIISISSFAMSILKYFYLNKFPIKSTLHSYTGYPAKVSSLEYEYITFLNFTKPQEDISHAFNSKEGQQRFNHILVDGYSASSKTVYQFHGCQVMCVNNFSLLPSHPLSPNIALAI